MLKHPNLKYLGHMAVFYIPQEKLDLYWGDSITNRTVLHRFLLKHANGYTHQESNIKGHWNSNSSTVSDCHERFEVSFVGKDKVVEFIDFLSGFCVDIQETCIYLTMGYKSYLVIPSHID